MEDQVETTSGGNAKAPQAPKALAGGRKGARATGYTAREDIDPYLRGRRDAIHELRASGGVSRSVVGIQVMYCLPDLFVKAYEELWDTATSGAIGAVSGKGVEQDKGSGRATGKANGIVLGSETGLQAAGGGKTWRNPTDFLGSDRALALKTSVDKELQDLGALVVRELGALRKRSAVTGSKRPLTPKCTGHGCGRFLKSGWKFCPVCGTERR